MKPDEIKIDDIGRILIGNIPPAFFIELVFRAFFIYLLLFISMRAMGQRMAAQLDKTELTAMVSLAAAIGIPIQSPDRGLLPAIVIAIIVIFVGKLAIRLSIRNKKWEEVAQDKLSMMIMDGVLDLTNMRKIGITREILFAKLRSEGVMHLGSVQRFYLEMTGEFSLLKSERPRPGLCVLPEWDKDFIRELKISDSTLVCKKCGNSIQGEHKNVKCKHCGNKEWIPAVETS
jgi:uncharacterized membrane protein YcaP (DUF421 family)